MPRANRYFIPGQIWHITQRCHKKEFLLKFRRDRVRWLHWLFEAKKRFGLTVLNYTVTSNHIHLLVQDGKNNQIARSLQLIASRTAQKFNIRKNRHGAFWEDRYHATAVDNGDYLIRCLVYIDLNMVRAGVVKHPAQWLQSGYNEIQSPPERYKIINAKSLCKLAGFDSIDSFRINHREWIEDALKKEQFSRDEKWTESLAVGGQCFVGSYLNSVGIKADGRQVKIIDDCHVIREQAIAYNTGL